MKLLSIGDAKTVKGESMGVRTAVLALRPHDLAGRGDICGASTAACRRDCLQDRGRGVMPPVEAARQRRTEYFFDDRVGFLEQLERELGNHRITCGRRGQKPAARLNAFSDLRWERIAPQLFDVGLQIYDYTKHLDRLQRHAEGDRWPPWYHLTASWSDEDGIGRRTRKLGLAGLAVPFAGGFPRVWHGCEVVDGDAHDLRFLDAKPGVVVAMAFKGRGGSRPEWTPGIFARPGGVRRER